MLTDELKEYQQRLRDWREVQLIETKINLCFHAEDQECILIYE